MSLSFSSMPFNGLLSYSSSPKFGAGPIKSRPLSFVITSKVRSNKDSSKPQGDRRSSRQVWRRRKLTKKDEFMEAKLQRVPFLEEQVRKMYEGGGILTGDIDRLMKSEENRFAFVNDIAAEAKSYVENNWDEYGTKKAILHVLTNRMNEAGFSRPEAYLEVDPYSPGPTYQKEFYT